MPQGRGRQFLAQTLKITDGEQQDLIMAQHGAFNPIGNLRLDTAVRFFQECAATTSDVNKGFSLPDIIKDRERFLEYIWIHSMLSAGTTGVQGAAPKFLLVQNADGRWFADASLPDEQAVQHWLVKLPRGSHNTDYAVLRNEAAYLQVAHCCGIRTCAPPRLHGDMLFTQRFDRVVDATGVHRLHQESLASLAGLRGFGVPVSLFDLVEAIRTHADNPVVEVGEFIKRDILNQAMRNTDNHARNTAMQRLPDGTVQLTPIFDFAPMYLDREFIVRSVRWLTGTRPEFHDWNEIIEALAGFCDTEKRAIALDIKTFLSQVEKLGAIMRDCGVEDRIIEDCRPTIDLQAERLVRLSIAAPVSRPRHG